MTTADIDEVLKSTNVRKRYFLFLALTTHLWYKRMKVEAESN